MAQWNNLDVEHYIATNNIVVNPVARRGLYVDWV